ncbi:MAG TPA: efflux RND transporter permease subunit [Gemmataceae bacterium]|nr:efflux RND transporter permease subunit [Gemmataceae bacterium]
MFARFFVDRPVFSTVISVVIVVVGLVALVMLPIAQYPEIAPPTITVTASYPGASAKVVADTVATPIEQEVNGVEKMLYMSSRCTNDGQMTLDITFKLGTNLDMAQVLVQNRVAIAQAKLPDDVKRQGVTTKKKSPSILLCINLISEKETDPKTGEERYKYDQLHLSNYATIHIKDALARIDGVGDVQFLGPRDYSMRIWLDPQKLASRNMTAGDVTNAVRKQNKQVAAGRLGQPPTPSGLSFQFPLNTLGRLETEQQFRQMVVKTDSKGGLTYLQDVVADDRKGQKGVELGAKNYDVNSFLDGDPSITLAIFQLPGSNALKTADAIKKKMHELKLPSGILYRIHYDTTVFIDESIHEVYKTLFEAFILVFIVVLVFLQDWRATLMPMIDVPVSLIGTFAVMAALGFSLNNLSLFGLVLAIGIVVDDAIVVVENIERWMAKGLPPREATIQAMGEITGPVIAITLVLSSVFIPTAFIAGISGQFFKQFALTIAASTIISAVNAMTMAPARAVSLIKPHVHGSERHEALPRLAVALIGGFAAYRLFVPMIAHHFGLVSSGEGHGEPAASESHLAALWSLRIGVPLAGAILGWFLNRPVNFALLRFFAGFNRVFEWMTAGYGKVVRGVLRIIVVMLIIYAGLIGLTALGFRAVPTGFIPQQDKGYIVVNAQLPDGASLERTDEVVARMTRIAFEDPGVAHTIGLPGYSILTSNNISNAGGMFIILKPFEERAGDPTLSANAVMARLRKAFFTIEDARVAVFGAPPVDGLGSTGGFKMQVQDRGGLGLEALQGAVSNVIDKGNAQPELIGLFSTFSTNQPQLYIDIDRVKAQKHGVDLDTISDTLQAYLGSAYVNDITLYNRNWQVNVQADAKFRMRPEDVGALKVRNAQGDMVPLSTMIAIKDISGPAIVNHYNLDPSAEIAGNTAPGTGSSQGIALMEKVARAELPDRMGFEWTELTYQQVLAADVKKNLSDGALPPLLAFPLAVLFVLLVLAAQYESWSLPLAILLIVPMCLLAAILGVWMTRLDNNIFTQVGLVVLIGLAAKNAILIVEFAKQHEDEGMSRIEATIGACTTRLRPILMTSFAFILGVAPLVFAKGAGAEMRVALGVAVFSGMLGVTFFGLFFTPVFYVVIRKLTARSHAAAKASVPAVESPARMEPATLDVSSVRKVEVETGIQTGSPNHPG